MFFLRKALSRLLFPLPLTLLVLVVGIALSWSKRGEKPGKALSLLGVGLLFVFSWPVTSTALLYPLESRYPALGPAQLAALDWDQVNTIVVYAGCGMMVESRPVTKQVGDSGAIRLIEGIRLYQVCPACTLILSGGGPGCDLNAPYERLTNYRYAVALGVAPEDIVIERASWDTADQARILRDMLDEEPFILVTSASHMPRSMALLRAQGLDPIAAPTDYAIESPPSIGWDAPRIHRLYPDARSLWRSERAVYEYLGLFWARVTGRLSAP